MCSSDLSIPDEDIRGEGFVLVAVDYLNVSEDHVLCATHDCSYVALGPLLLLVLLLDKELASRQEVGHQGSYFGAGLYYGPMADAVDDLQAAVSESGRDSLCLVRWRETVVRAGDQ